MAKANRFLAFKPHPPTFGPQNGIKATEAATMTNEPKKPDASPCNVTPPFVPGGTSRRFQDVMSRGLLFDNMPSSELNVSAATAAYFATIPTTSRSPGHE